jgi:quercetin dioxygenase-like cupin family protein
MKLINIDKKQAGPPADPDWFPGGGVLQQRIHTPDDDGKPELVGVWFEAGSRTKPHTHAADQILHVLEGEGVVATEHEKRRIRPGDIVVIPAGAWHWHGATPDTSMCHVSVKPKGPTDWSSPFGDWDSYMEGVD